jgi:hypothetical protein
MSNGFFEVCQFILFLRKLGVNDGLKSSDVSAYCERMSDE